MAGALEDGDQVGFEEGMSWLPSQVLDEAFSDINNYNKRQVKTSKLPHQPQQQHSRPHSKLPAESLPQSKTGSRIYSRPNYPTNWVSKGAGMQAIFLDSAGQRSCGTGVFLPQRGGTNFQTSRKPACAPVLLPSRVVQALNLNVHEIGLRISPRQDSKTRKSKCGDCNSVKNESIGNYVSAGNCCVICQNQSSSPEIFLPKEWTY